MSNFAIQNKIIIFFFLKWLVGSSTLDSLYFNVVLFDIDTRLCMEDIFNDDVNGRVSKSNL